MSAVLTPIVAASENPAPAGSSLARRLWDWSWPKLLALGLVIAVWQIVVWTGWRPKYVLPGPLDTFRELGDLVTTGRFWHGVATTMLRAVIGFSLALVIGTLIGVLVTRVKVLRLAVGSLITGLQTMPSISWFPLAILLFGLTEQAILFVVVLGAAPSIANGVISGIDQVPPSFRKLGAVLGARGWSLYRYIVLPAALPGYVSGLTQGWAFAWRSLMAGELLVIIASRPSLGGTLDFARQFNRSAELLAIMLVILIIGMVVDGVFSSAARRIRTRRGLTAA